MILMSLARRQTQVDLPSSAEEKDNRHIVQSKCCTADITVAQSEPQFPLLFGLKKVKMTYSGARKKRILFGDLIFETSINVAASHLHEMLSATLQTHSVHFSCIA